MGKSDSKASQVEERINAKALKGEGAQHVQITDKQKARAGSCRA